MKSADEIKRFFKNAAIETNPETDREVLDKVLGACGKTADTETLPERSAWRIIAKSGITQVAVVLIVLSAICLLTLSDKGETEQHEAAGLEIAVISETPAELVSVIALNMAFRDGGMQAIEKQFDKAEKKVKPGLKTRLTVDQLICELDGC